MDSPESDEWAQAVTADDRILALEARIAQMNAELRALQRVNEWLQEQARKARGAISMVGSFIDAHEAVLLSLVHATPGVAADVDDALAQSRFAELVGADAVACIREFRRRLDCWQALAEAAGQPSSSSTLQ